MNALIPMGARGLDLVFALVYFRVLGEDLTGAYQFLVVFTTYLDTLVDFGLNTVLARDLARAPGATRAAFKAVNLLRLGLWLVGLPLVAIVYGPAQGMAGLSPAAAAAGWVFYLALMPSILAKTATGLLWAAERLDVTGGVSIVGSVLKTVLGFLVLVAGMGLMGLALSSLVVNVVSAVLLLLLARRWHPRATASSTEGQAALPTVPTMVRESWPLFLNQLLQGLFFKIDSLLLPGIAGAGAAGAYAAAYKVNEGMGVVSSSATLALFPRLSRSAVRGGEELTAMYRLALRTLLQVACPLAVGTALLAPSVVVIVGGRGFLPDSAIALSLLIWYLPFSFANGLTQYVLIAVGKQRFLTGAFLLAFVFNVSANLVLIPRFGYIGAAWITVLSEIVLLVPFRLAAGRWAPGVSLLHEVWQAAVAAAVMGAAMWVARDTVGPGLAFLVGLVVYPACLWLLGGVEPEQRRLLRSLVPALRRDKAQIERVA